MAVATVMTNHVSKGDFAEWNHPAEIGTVCLALVVIGAGIYSVDQG